MGSIDKDTLLKKLSDAIQEHERSRSTSTAPTDAKDYAKFQGILAGLAEAIDVVNTFDGRIDLAMLDILMPDMNGNIIYPFLKKIRPDLPVILCTGSSDELDHGQIDCTGIREILMKPLLTRKLAEAVRKVLDGYRAEVIDTSGDQ